MVWILVSFFRYPSTDIYEYLSDRTSWSLTPLTGSHELYKKWYLICKLHFLLLNQMMSSIVFFCQGLSLNLISTLYQARKLKLMEVHTLSPLRTIYAQRTIGLDSDVLHDLVPFVQFKKREKHPWRSNFTASNTPPSVFFTFLKL